jgi:uncharacterized membrane protein (DUF485 family)
MKNETFAFLLSLVQFVFYGAFYGAGLALFTHWLGPTMGSATAIGLVLLMIYESVEKLRKALAP